MKVLLVGEAVRDLDAGVEFYEMQSAGLGDYFLDSLLQDLETLAHQGGSHQLLMGSHRKLASVFPYAIYYRIEHDVVRVLAILDCRRDPSRIKERLMSVQEQARSYPENRPPDLLREQHYKISEVTVHQMPEQERPRELCDRIGMENLADKHLIALILRSGVRGHNVVDIAEGLLKEYGTLQTMAQVSVEDLARVPGMGKVRAQVLKAALELARRVTAAPPDRRMTVRTPPEALQALLSHGVATHREFETFWVILLNRRYQLCRPPLEITRGILDASLVHPREVFKEAIRANSAALLLLHNHPSGDPTPSAEDIRITRQLVDAGKVVQIDVLDHIVVGSAAAGGREYVSLRESGLVSFGG